MGNKMRQTIEEKHIDVYKFYCKHCNQELISHNIKVFEKGGVIIKYCPVCLHGVYISTRKDIQNSQGTLPQNIHLETHILADIL